MTAPKTAKTPTDRKPKVGSDRVVIVDGKEWTVPESALDDFELLDDLGELENGNAARLPRVMRRLLGDDYKRALDGLRDDDGRVRIGPASDFVRSLLEGLDPNS